MGLGDDSCEKGKPYCTVNRDSLRKLLSEGQGTWWQTKGWLKRQFFLLAAELVSCALCVCVLRKEALTVRIPPLNSYPQEGFLGSGAFVKDGPHPKMTLQKPHFLTTSMCQALC